MTTSRTVIAVAAALLLGGCGYQAIPQSENAVSAAWAEVENQYQRRADLVPNLVETVKGYAAHEKTVLENVTKARSQAVQASGVQEKAKAEQELMGGVTIEFGGRRLALLRWTLFVRWLVVAWLVVTLFAPLPVAGVPGAILEAIEVLALFGLVSGLTVLAARLRIDHLRVYLVQIGILMVFALLFALIGV
jgi:hypothetical protein